MTSDLAIEPSGTSLADAAWQAARDVAAVLTSEANETERLGTISPAGVVALRESDLFWLIVPRELGGLGLDVVTLIRVVEELSRADGSSGWSYMANALSTGVAAAFCGDDAADAAFGGPVPAIFAGMLGPGGACVEVDGGYVGGGRYSFASGAGHADWLAAGMFVLEDGRPRTLDGGLPEVRVCMLPCDRAEMMGNWDVMGLVGTGSVDFRVPDQFIGSGYTFERATLSPRRGGPSFSLGIAGFASAGHTAVALGIAARALQEISIVASGKKRPAYPSVVADHPLFRQDFSYHEASYQAARAFVYDVYTHAHATVADGGELSTEQRQRFRQAATYTHRIAADVVRFCYTWGGSDALRNPSALGRCMRDISGATQHIYVDPITMVDAAPALIDHWITGWP